MTAKTGKEDVAVVGLNQREFPAVPDVVGTIQVIRNGIMELQRVLPTWSDEELAQFFSETSHLEGAFYAARCYVCRVLAERYGGAEDKAGLRRAASILGISYGYARELSSIWLQILSKLEDGLPALPQAFFGRALRAGQYGVDPVEAVRHAIHIREALGQPYTVQQFVNDIRHGLPNAAGSPPRSCSLCVHYATGAGRLVLMTDAGDILAEAETAGVRYCDKYGLLRSALGDLRVRAGECPEFTLAPSTTEGGQDETFQPKRQRTA